MNSVYIYGYAKVYAFCTSSARNMCGLQYKYVVNLYFFQIIFSNFVTVRKKSTKANFAKKALLVSATFLASERNFFNSAV